MASTHTKNATKPKSSKILQLKTARKKINWTTQKTLERATITLSRNGSEGPILGVYDGDYIGIVLSVYSQIIKLAYHLG